MKIAKGERKRSSKRTGTENEYGMPMREKNLKQRGTQNQRNKKEKAHTKGKHDIEDVKKNGRIQKSDGPKYIISEIHMRKSKDFVKKFKNIWLYNPRRLKISNHVRLTCT